MGHVQHSLRGSSIETRPRRWRVSAPSRSQAKNQRKFLGRRGALRVRRVHGRPPGLAQRRAIFQKPSNRRPAGAIRARRRRRGEAPAASLRKMIVPVRGAIIRAPEINHPAYRVRRAPGFAGVSRSRPRRRPSHEARAGLLRGAQTQRRHAGEAERRERDDDLPADALRRRWRRGSLDGTIMRGVLHRV